MSSWGSGRSDLRASALPRGILTSPVGRGQQGSGMGTGATPGVQHGASASTDTSRRPELRLGYIRGAGRSWARGPLRLLPRPVQFSTQELVQVLWACARMGIALPQRWMNAALAAFTVMPAAAGRSGRAERGAAAVAPGQRAAQVASGPGKPKARGGGTDARTSGSSSSDGSGSGRSSSGSSQAGACRSRLDHAQPQDMSLLLYSLARLGQKPPSLSWYRDLLMAAASKLPAFSPQNLANLVWAMSELQLPPDLGWMLCWMRAVRRRSLQAFNVAELNQLRQGLQGLGLQQHRGRGITTMRSVSGSPSPSALGVGPADARQLPGAAAVPSTTLRGSGTQGEDTLDWTLLLPPLPHHPELLALLRDVERELQKRRRVHTAAISGTFDAPGSTQRRPGA